MLVLVSHFVFSHCRFRYKGPYNCPKCTKQFTRRFNLQLHLQKGCAKKKRNSYWPANKEEFEEYGELHSGLGIWHVQPCMD